MFKSLLSAVAEAVTNGGPANVTEVVAEHIKQEMVTESHRVKMGEITIPLFFTHLSEVYLLGCVETNLCVHAEFLVDELRKSGKPAMPNEVRRAVIEQIRDCKVAALEADGRVNPIDLMTIKMKSSAYARKAQARFTSMRMHGRPDSSPIGLLQVLNEAEEYLLGEASEENSQSYEAFQRAAQGIVVTVADLRLQYVLGG